MAAVSRLSSPDTDRISAIAGNRYSLSNRCSTVTNELKRTMSDTNEYRASAGRDDTIVEQIPTESSTSTSVSIVRAVARAESVTPGELPVLAEVIDPESVDELFDSNPAVGRSGVLLSFDYCGYSVQVTDEFVTLRR